MTSNRQHRNKALGLYSNRRSVSFLCVPGTAILRESVKKNCNIFGNQQYLGRSKCI